MRNRLFSYIKVFFIVSVLWTLNFSVYAAVPASEENFYLDKAEVVSQQIELLKNRLLQAKNELTSVQASQEARLNRLSLDHVNKEWLTRAKLDVTIANSNLDSIDIELSESQQTISSLEKDTQEIENQLNIYNIFGLKIAHNGIPDPDRLQSELRYQKKLLQIEKVRAGYLWELRKTVEGLQQLYDVRYKYILTLLKSQTMLQLKERQAKSEINFQQQQSNWLKQLNNLHSQLIQLEHSKSKDAKAYIKLENDIFYVNENNNFTYLEMLIIRYQDQIRQLKFSISRSNSITLLNKVRDQVQLLSKQFVRVNGLLKERLNILNKRKFLLAQEKEKIHIANIMQQLTQLENQYKTAVILVSNLDKQLVIFRMVLDRALQQELSSRQGLPGLALRAWLDLGNELWLVPALTFQVGKSLAHVFIRSLYSANTAWWLLAGLFEIIWISVCIFLGRLLSNLLSGMQDHEFGHINLKWLTIKLLRRSLIDIAIIGNILGLFFLSRIPLPNFDFLINLGLIWLFFKGITTMARLCLVETMHDSAGHDVRLYHRLKWSFLIGGIVTALTVFMHQLPVIYEVKDFFDRLFLLFLLIVSIFLLKSWEVLPGLILPYIDERRTYFRKVVRLLGLLIPLILLVNSAIGLFGFVNFVLTVSWYEGIFLIVLAAYLVVRGFLSDGMELVSRILIQHVSNGWLWTEAFLKPIDKVIRIVLFLTAWVVLFILYGWNQQSPVVERLTKLLHYRLIDVLNTTITPLSVIELVVIVSFLYWAARWTREFVYRLLLSRTRDMGIRNSIAILSQYTVIVISIFICLRVLGIDFRALTVVASMFAIGVGLGLRDLFNNFACGFLLLLERPLRVGDIVSISEYEGEVIHIGGRAVTIRTWDHIEVIVPNAEIFSKLFTNWTARDNVVRSVISIKIDRHDKPQEVQHLIYQVLANHKSILGEPASEVFIKELAAEVIEFEVRYYINLRQVRSRIEVRSQVLFAVWEAFEKHGIKPPYPHHEIYVRNNIPITYTPE